MDFSLYCKMHGIHGMFMIFTPRFTEYNSFVDKLLMSVVVAHFHGSELKRQKDMDRCQGKYFLPLQFLAVFKLVSFTVCFAKSMYEG